MVVGVSPTKSKVDKFDIGNSSHFPRSAHTCAQHNTPVIDGTYDSSYLLASGLLLVSNRRRPAAGGALT